MCWPLSPRNLTTTGSRSQFPRPPRRSLVATGTVLEVLHAEANPGQRSDFLLTPGSHDAVDGRRHLQGAFYIEVDEGVQFCVACADRPRHNSAKATSECFPVRTRCAAWATVGISIIPEVPPLASEDA